MSITELVISLTMRKDQLEIIKAEHILKMYPDGPDTIGDEIDYEDFLAYGIIEGKISIVEELLSLLS